MNRPNADNTSGSRLRRAALLNLIDPAAGGWLSWAWARPLDSR